MQRLPGAVIVDADFFISYLRGDEMADKAEELLNLALEKKISLLASSEIYDDLITAYRSQGYGVDDLKNMLRDIRVIPHEAVPVVVEIAILAMDLYSKYGGSRKLHYFDSFHVATSFVVNKPLLTSDKYILEKSAELGIKAIDLRRMQL